MGFAYVVEHMEEDDEATRNVPPWVNLEYAHMRTLAGPNAEVHFTHLSPTSCGGLLESIGGDNSSQNQAGVFAHSLNVLGLMKEKGVKLEEVCLLDPKAEKVLAPEDGDGRFKWFLFGGILGDDPPRDRTSELRVLGFPNRHLGPVQMTTDTAVGVTKLVVADQLPLDEIDFIDNPTITFNPKESIEMPFRYIKREGHPVLPPGMKELLYEDLNKAVDFGF